MCDVEGSDPARRRIQTDRRHLTLSTRISPFAGRVTEAAHRGNTMSSAERGELRPAATRMTCSDVHASTARRQQGVRETASRGSRRFTLSRKRTCQRASSTRSLPNHVTSRAQQWVRFVTVLAARNFGHRSRLDAPPGDDEGAIGRDALHRGVALGTKASSGERDPIDETRRSAAWRQAHDRARGPESSRVRPDHVLCCIAPAMSERSASFSWEPHAQACGYNQGVHAAPIRERRRDAKGEGSPDRGSSVPFTRCEVSRSRLDDERVFFIASARVQRATGVSDVARDSSTRREDNARSEQEPGPPKRATAS